MAGAIYHGGDLSAAARRFGEPAGGWLDLSTGINPVPYPVGDVTPDDWTRLPGREAEAELEAIAARGFGMTSPGQLMVVPGTQAAIQALPRHVRPKSVAILGFTYQEHAVVWRAHGASVRTLEALDAAALGETDVLVVVNPNNPDGRIIPRETLLKAGAIVTRRGGFVVVDEAFMDMIGPDDSILPAMPATGWVVLRSFGKTWGLAGLRLGFVAGPASTIAAMRRETFGPWAINGPALKIGARALADHAWLRQTRARLATDVVALDRILRDAGLDVIGGTPLFRLTQSPEAAAIFERLGNAGILVRPFADRPHWLRFGVPATDTDRDRLRAALVM